MTDTFQREISGRTITFQLPTDAQLLVIGRLLRTAEATGEDPDKLSGTVLQLSKLLDIIDSMVVEPGDRDWLESLILERKINMSELVEVLREQEEPNRSTRRSTKKATKAVRKTTARRTTARASEE